MDVRIGVVLLPPIFDGMLSTTAKTVIHTTKQLVMVSSG